MEGRNRNPRKFARPNRHPRSRLNHILRRHRKLKLAAQRLPYPAYILF